MSQKVNCLEEFCLKPTLCPEEGLEAAFGGSRLEILGMNEGQTPWCSSEIRAQEVWESGKLCSPVWASPTAMYCSGS